MIMLNYIILVLYFLVEIYDPPIHFKEKCAMMVILYSWVIYLVLMHMNLQQQL
jgi:hypothetical protein